MANRLDNLQVFPAKLFSWRKELVSFKPDKWTGVAELSDLGENPFSQIWCGEYDKGFSVSGREKTLTFSITEIVRDPRENEILHYVMTCITDPNFEIILFND